MKNIILDEVEYAPTKTPMTLLFEEFESLSSASRKAGDELSSNLIDFLCERKKVALEKEKELACQFAKEYINGASYDTLEDYYNEKYQNNS